MNKTKPDTANYSGISKSTPLCSYSVKSHFRIPYRKITILLFFAFLLFMQAQAQVNSSGNQINRELNNYLLGNIQEKVYVQTNSNLYSPGDTIWFKSSLVNAITHAPDPLEKLLYIDLISPENKVICHQVFRIFFGFSAGCLPLKVTAKSGTYKLVTYTNYMKNFPNDFLFSKNIEVAGPNNEKIDWQFSPELSPQENSDSVQVTVKAISPSGLDLITDVDVRIQLGKGVVLGQTFPLTGNRGAFSFFIPDSLRGPSTAVILNRTDAPGSKEYFQIELSKTKPDLQFLPEGGDLLTGHDNLVAFRCTDGNGNPLEVSGEILDPKQKPVAWFQSEYRGMGTFLLHPAGTRPCTARIRYRDTTYEYSLPSAKANAYGIRLLKQEGDSLHLLLTMAGKQAVDFSLLAHTRGIAGYMRTGSLTGKDKMVTVPKSLFPSGITVFTLFAKQVPVAERLVYIDHGDSLNISVTQNKQQYGKRERIDMDVRVTDHQGRPVQGSFSLNAWDCGMEQSLDPKENIRNYFLLSSDLQGAVWQNLKDFDQSCPSFCRHTDLLMLTCGWRRFSWEDIRNKQKITKPKFAMETGFNLSGKVRRKINNKPVPKNFEITLLLKKNDKVLMLESAKTDKQGRFELQLPVFSDSAKLTVQTQNRLGWQLDYIIDLQTNLENKKISVLNYDKVSSVLMSPTVSNDADFNAKENGTETFAIPRQPRKDHYYSPGQDTVLIQEVVVKASLPTLRDSIINQFGTPDVVITSNQLKTIVENTTYYSSLWDLLRTQIPGLTITVGDKTLRSISNFGVPFDGVKNTYLCFFVHDNPILKPHLNSPMGNLYIYVDNNYANSNFDILSILDVSAIKSIDFIAITSNFEKNIQWIDDLFTDGYYDPNKLQQAPSFLFITTKSGKGVYYRRKKGIMNLVLNGFSEYREFYSPKYETPQSFENTNTDFRKTIYWEPNLATDSTGRAGVSFYTSESNNPIGLLIQGVSLTGQTGVKSFRLNENELPAPLAFQKPDTEPEDPDYSQYKLICGTVYELESGIPLKSARLTQPNPYYHACTNNQGEFLLDKDRILTDSAILVSCPGYISKVIYATKNGKENMDIYLTRAELKETPLAESPVQIVRKAIRLSATFYQLNKAYMGYHREVVSVNNDAYCITESAFSYTNNGKPWDKKWLRYQTERFQKTEDQNGHSLLLLKPNHRDWYYPLKSDVISVSPLFWNPNQLTEFNYHILGEIMMEDKACYKISFKQRDEAISPLQQGTMYIEKETYALRFVQWAITPDRLKYLNYVDYLKANPLNYNLKVQKTAYEASYAFDKEQLVLQSTKKNIVVLVNGTDIYQIDAQLSVSGKSLHQSKLENRTPDLLIQQGKSKHIMVKEIRYQPKYWIKQGIIKPENNLIRDLKFMHDITFFPDF